jgi:cytochrome c oxidase assembly protein subunit 15
MSRGNFTLSSNATPQGAILEQMADEPRQPSTFAKFAWFTLAFDLVVILWGVFLRASHSGDGCGRHWLTCQGEVIPSAPQLKTIIEFTHRVTTEIAGVLVVVMAVWAFFSYGKRSPVRWASGLSLLFIIFEGLIGAGLVLTGNTADSWTPSRPYWTAGHLVNTFILLSFLALTPWLASAKRQINFSRPAKIWLLIGIGIAAVLFVGITGSMAALSTMLFPSGSLAEGLAKDFSPDSNYLLRLRISHPILSIISAVYLVFLSGWLRAWSDRDRDVGRWANILTGVVIAQIAFGAATLLTLAPIVLQLGHLLLADLVWITLILLIATFLTTSSDSRVTDG